MDHAELSDFRPEAFLPVFAIFIVHCLKCPHILSDTDVATIHDFFGKFLAIHFENITGLLE